MDIVPRKIQDLPDEVILHILKFLSKSVKDVISVHLTSRRLCKLSTDNHIWGGWGCSIETKNIDEIYAQDLTKIGVIESLKLSNIKPKLAGSLFSNIVPSLKTLDIGKAHLWLTPPMLRCLIEYINV